MTSLQPLQSLGEDLFSGLVSAVREAHPPGAPPASCPCWQDAAPRFRQGWRRGRSEAWGPMPSTLGPRHIMQLELFGEVQGADARVPECTLLPRPDPFVSFSQPSPQEPPRWIM